MRPSRALTLFLAIGGTLLLISAYYLRRTPPVDAGAGAATTPIRLFKDPSPVEPFTAVDLGGRTITSDALRGKVVIVNFWATWCPPCRAEIPDLIALQNKYRDRLQIIGIADEESAEDVKRFAEEHHINYPVVMTTDALTRVFPGVQALPTSFILDPEGRLAQKHVGMLQAEVTELETRALAGLPVNATIERVERAQRLQLENGAQLTEIPGVDLASLSKSQRVEALQKLNEKSCTCGCDLTVAKCRVDDPSCGVSLPLARAIVRQIVSNESQSPQ